MATALLKTDAGEQVKPLPERLRRVTREPMVQVAPGKWAPAPEHGEPPETTMAHWVGNGDGSYHLVPFRERMIRLTPVLAKALGFRGDYSTLRRLGAAGFVEFVQVAPRTTLLNMDSYYNHLRRCAEDPEFWDDAQRLRVYQMSYRRVD